MRAICRSSCLVPNAGDRVAAAEYNVIADHTGNGIVHIRRLAGSLDVAMNLHAVGVERASEKPLMSGFHAPFSNGRFLGSGAITALLSRHIVPSTSTILSSAIAGRDFQPIYNALPVQLAATGAGRAHALEVSIDNILGNPISIG
jgi:hypothetical protein